MVVTHNLQAQNANRMLKLTGTNLQKATEKLSSGYKINRAADDAAGLAISEKMRTQIRGLRRASQNALDGISVVQTAEGALSEMQSMLHRINELCTQAANDTNTDIDRGQIQKEINQLVREIEDTTQRTTFNTMPILGGINRRDASGTIVPDSEGVQGLQTYFTAKDNLTGVFPNGTVDTATGELTQHMSMQTPLDGTAFWFINMDPANPTYTAAQIAKAENTEADYVLIKPYVRPDGSDMEIRAILSTHEKDPTSGRGLYTPKELIDNYTVRLHEWDPTAVVEYQNGIDGVSALVHRDYGSDVADVWLSRVGTQTFLNLNTWSDVNDPFNMKLQVGALSGQYIELSIDHLNVRALDIAGLFVDSFEDAGKAMEKVQKAIDKVSGTRATLGAQQNRLEHTIANLDNTAENTEAAESRIRDTDMARTMVEYTKMQILQQAGQTVLAQANTSTQGVLALLG